MRRSTKANRRCPRNCTSDSTYRIGSAAECGIPNAIWAVKRSDEDGFYCYHCGVVWFQAKGPHVRLQGHYRGDKVFEPMTEDIVYVVDHKPRQKPKAATKR